MGLKDKTFQCFSLKPKVCKSLRKSSKTLFYLNIANIVLASVIFFPKFYCNIMSIRDANLCANLNKEPKPKTKLRYSRTYF